MDGAKCIFLESDSVLTSDVGTSLERVGAEFCTSGFR